MAKKDVITAVVGLASVFIGLFGLLSVPEEPACISAPASPYVMLYTILFIAGILVIVIAIFLEFKE